MQQKQSNQKYRLLVLLAIILVLIFLTDFFVQRGKINSEYVAQANKQMALEGQKAKEIDNTLLRRH